MPGAAAQGWSNACAPIGESLAGHRRISLRGSRFFPLDRGGSYSYNVHMGDVRFAWDSAKDRLNRRRHGVSFAEAQSVFFDERAIRYYDPDHSQNEDRFIMLGMSFLLCTLVVCHCYRADDSVIRIISARRANTAEERAYAARGGDR
jgi:uncharacterized DUF497 family protein